VALELQVTAAAEELRTGWARPALRQEWERKSLGLILSASGKQGRMMKVESCSAREWFFLSFMEKTPSAAGH